MNLKHRIASIVLMVAFVMMLAYLSVHSIYIGKTVDAIMLQKQNATYRSNVRGAGNDKSAGVGLYQKYMYAIERLKYEVHRVRKKFLSWRAHMQLNKKRKNITMDVMNEGHQSNCRELTLLIMVSSELSHKTRRDVIRSTYLNQTHWREYSQKREISFGMLFIVGRSKNETQMASVMSESKQQGDMLVLDLEESFYSLSYKVMIGFQWVTERCQGYRFLLKGDDDIFVNIHAIMELLHEPTTPQTHLYVGNTMSVAEVIRNGRYGVSREEYQRDNYPRYNSGGGFVVSSDVVRNMIPHFNWITPLKIDDAYMGGLILKAGIDCINDERFHMYDEGCVFRNKTIVSHTNDKIVVKPKCAKYLNDEALNYGLRELRERNT
jgi:Galactosyltransferase.